MSGINSVFVLASAVQGLQITVTSHSFKTLSMEVLVICNM